MSVQFGVSNIKQENTYSPRKILYKASRSRNLDQNLYSNELLLTSDKFKILISKLIHIKKHLHKSCSFFLGKELDRLSRYLRGSR